MTSNRERATYLVLGAAAGASLVGWLCYARSAEKPRRMLSEAAEGAARRLGRIEDTAVALQRRAEEFDRLLKEIIELGREKKVMAEAVLMDTLHKFEHTTDVVQDSMVESAREISSLLTQIRRGLDALLSSRRSRAA